ncbi:SRPBCC family protein [Paenibacillus sp. CC-CFT747]|nr:SRPBCC family protein [Paenibacillus sp. CC-CFT747]
MKTISQDPVVQTSMLIRRPVGEVFEAFVNPEVTTKFWYTRSSGRMEAGKRIQWYWDMYGAAADVDVVAVEPDKRIRIEWDEGVGVEWDFTPRSPEETMVTITNSGFHGNGDEVVAQAVDSMQGFTMVLCGLKAYLEHNVILNLVADKAPDAHVTG